MIKKDGPVDVTIVAACVGAPKYPPSERDSAANSKGEAIAVWGDVILTCQDADGNTDSWHGELSNRNGVGNYAQVTHTEMTLETLQKIGFAVADWNALYAQIDEDGNIPNILNMQATANIVSREYDGKTYYDVKYLNPLGSGGPKKMSKAELLASLNGGGFRKGQAPSAPAASAPAASAPATPAANSPAAPGGIPAPSGTGGAPANPYGAQQ